MTKKTDDREKKLDEFFSHEEQILRQSKAKAMAAMNQSPTTDNIRSYERAGKALADFIARKEPSAQPIKTIEDAVTYLTQQGYKIGKSKLADDAAKGYPRKTKGHFTAQALTDYAKKTGLPLLTTGDDNYDKLTERKLIAETLIVEENAARRQMDNQIQRGEYIRRSTVEQQFTARAVFLKSSLENFIRSRASDIIKLCGGDTAKAPDTIDYCLTELHNTLDHYSQPIQFMAAIATESEEEEIGEIKDGESVKGPDE